MDWQVEKRRLQKAANLAREILEGFRLLRRPVDPEAIASRERGLDLIGEDFGDR